MPEGSPFRVLSLDGGGMRGTYTATYLSCLCDAFSRKRGITGIDLGAAFDLIVGTSTGAIIGCALAAGVPLVEVVRLYREHGTAIFSRPVPQAFGWQLYRDRKKRPAALAAGASALRKALTHQLGSTTLSEIYERRHIALAITAVEMSQHRSWVFKTPHLQTSMGRDNGYSLVDVCMASSAAPVFRSMARLPRPDGIGHNTFVDGGLWANNPVLVGLIDSLELTTPDREIEIFCIGTCPRPAGEQIAATGLDRGLGEWRFGSAAAALSIDAQEFAYDNMARMLAKHVQRARCDVTRFPRDQIPAALMPHLDLDDTSSESIDALIAQARTDAEMTNSHCSNANSTEGRRICALFNSAPPISCTADLIQSDKPEE